MTTALQHLYLSILIISAFGACAGTLAGLAIYNWLKAWEISR